MRIRDILLLSAALVCSAIVFSQLDRLLIPGSVASSICMVSLAMLDFALIIYFFRRMRAAEVLHSTQLVNLIASMIVIIFWLVQGLAG